MTGGPAVLEMTISGWPTAFDAVGGEVPARLGDCARVAVVVDRASTAARRKVSADGTWRST